MPTLEIDLDVVITVLILLSSGLRPDSPGTVEDQVIGIDAADAGGEVPAGGRAIGGLPRWCGGRKGRRRRARGAGPPPPVIVQVVPPA